MSDHHEANIFDSGPGKRNRRPPERYFDEDEAKILARRGFDADAMEEAERSDTEIPQTDDEEEEEEEDLDEGEEEFLIEEEEDGDWNPGVEDVSTSDDEVISEKDSEEVEPAQVVFLKFDSNDELCYKAFGTDSICLELSYDHFLEDKVPALAAVVSSLCTIFVCEKPNEELPRLMELLHQQDPDEWPDANFVPTCYLPKDTQIIDNYVDLEEIDNFFYM